MRVEEEGSLSEAGVANFGVGGGRGIGTRLKVQGKEFRVPGSGSGEKSGFGRCGPVRCIA